VSVHRNHILIHIQQDAMLHNFILSENCSKCFGWYHHPSLGAQTTVSTASGICHTVTSICRYRENAGTGLTDSSNGVTNTRCCRYSCLHSWCWVMVPPETRWEVSRQNKLCHVASCWIYITITFALLTLKSGIEWRS